MNAIPEPSEPMGGDLVTALAGLTVPLPDLVPLPLLSPLSLLSLMPISVQAFLIIIEHWKPTFCDKGIHLSI